MEKSQRIPEPTISRLPIYFRCLTGLKQEGLQIISSEAIAALSGVKASQFRKDLSYFGEFGIQGMGYPVSHLLERIAAIMQLNRIHKMVLVGAGNLGSALANYDGFVRWGFNLCEIFDADPRKIGHQLGHLTIQNVADLPRPLDATIGVIAVPAPAGHQVAQLLIESGISALLNFSGAQLISAENIIIRNVDLTHELAILNYFQFTARRQEQTRPNHHPQPDRSTSE